MLRSERRLSADQLAFVPGLPTCIGVHGAWSFSHDFLRSFAGEARLVGNVRMSSPATVLKLIRRWQTRSVELSSFKYLKLQMMWDKRMKAKDKSTTDPPWLDPSNDRKTPYSDAELEDFVDDFSARMADTKAWHDLVEDVGDERARQILKEQMAAQDRNSLINWEPDGLLH